MGASLIFRPTSDSMDAVQNTPGGGGYSLTGQTSGLAIQAATVASGMRSLAAVRFPGQIPAGTTGISYASVTGFCRSDTSTSPISFKIYAEIPANVTTGPAVFPASSGVTDILPTHRTYSTSFTQENYTAGPTLTYEFVLNQDTIKELLTAAGASSFSGAGTTIDPYVAANPTTQDINDIVLFLVGDTLTAGTTPTSQRFRATSYDQYTADVSSSKFATLFQVTTLNISTVSLADTVVGTDERVHVFIWGDSLTWPYSPDLTWDGVTPRPTDSLYAGLDFTGNPTQALFHMQDSTTAVIPPGETYGGVNRGYVTFQQGSQWYTVLDPTGSVYHHGAIQPEARSGWTKLGVLKDRIAAKLGVHPDRVIIHSFGYGGSSAGRYGGTTGIWSEVNRPSDARTTLDTITDPTTALATITNPLWNKNRDQTGKTFVQCLMDSTIKYALFLGSIDGNDLFDGFSGNNLTITLPIAGNMTPVTNAYNAMLADNKRIWSFIKLMRDHYATLPGAINEAHHVGYYNFVAQDPRVPPITVNIGPPSYAAMHNGTYQSLANPDDWYGGPNGTSTPAGGVANAMAPYGNAGEAHPAASPGVGSVNAMPMVPMTFFYPFGNVIPGVPPPKTNIVGQPVNCNWTSARPFNMDDLDIPHQLLMGDRFGKTWQRDFDTNYRDWFAHWAADTSYSNTLYSQAANSSGWNNAFLLFQNNITVGSFPWHSAAGTGSGPNIPLNTMAIAIPYTGRNINNQTVNECVHATCGQAAIDGMTYMQGQGMTCQYVDLHDAIGTSVGSGVTASADRGMYLDGVHPTYAASIMLIDNYLDRALAAGSPLLQKLVAEAHSSMFLAMI